MVVIIRQKCHFLWTCLWGYHLQWINICLNYCQYFRAKQKLPSTVTFTPIPKSMSPDSNINTRKHVFQPVIIGDIICSRRFPAANKRSHTYTTTAIFYINFSTRACSLFFSKNMWSVTPKAKYVTYFDWLMIVFWCDLIHWVVSIWIAQPVLAVYSDADNVIKAGTLHIYHIVTEAHVFTPDEVYYQRKQFRKIPSFIQSLKSQRGTYITFDHWSLYFSIRLIHAGRTRICELNILSWIWHFKNISQIPIDIQNPLYPSAVL